MGNIGTIISAIMASVSAVLVAIIARRGDSDKKEREERQREADAKSEKVEAYIIHSIDLNAATLDLSVELALAMKENNFNGNIDRAVTRAADAKRDYYKNINTAYAKDVAE